MIRLLFTALAAAAALLMLIVGGGTYLISQSNVSTLEQKAADANAQNIANTIFNQTNTAQNIIIKMAESSEVVNAIESKDTEQRAKTAQWLEQFLPNVQKIRLLPADVSELDASDVPHMGNADLIMAKETLLSPQLPSIQGLAENRHLAITAVIKKNDVSIGIVLASLKYHYLTNAFKNKLSSELGLFELKQGNAVLANTRNTHNNFEANNKRIIPQTPWSVHYSLSNSLDLVFIGLMAAMILAPTALICVACFVVYRNISQTLRRDLNSVVKIVKDRLSNRHIGSYPVKLTEMNPLILAITKAKIDNEENDMSEFSDAVDESDSFFDAPAGLDILSAESGFDDETLMNTSSSLLSMAEDDNDLDSLNFDDSLLNITNQYASSNIFRAYDIRGIVGDALSEDIIFTIGQAIASEAKEQNIKTIVLGRDGRNSSPALADSLAKGIISTGVNVFDIGLVPSPVVYFVAHHTEGKSGVVVTGSHNPANYNGVKTIINGEMLAGNKIKQLEQRISTQDFATGETASIETNSLFSNEYIGSIAENIHIERPMKIVVDCGNGATSEIAPILLKTLGCEVIELFCEIDGSFPNHHPDPSNPDNMADLITAVKHYEADIGIAFDGDGDRLGVIDSKGKIIWPDRQMMLFAKTILADKPGAEIIYDVKSSRHLGEQISKYGGKPLMSRTGHSFMKEKLHQTGAVLAGEMSGHIFFNDRWFGFDDALYAASRLIEILSTDSRNSSEVFADFPDSINTPEINIELKEGENTAFMSQFIETATFKKGKIIDIDGLRVEFSDGWGLVRASNTLPMLALRFEADNKKALKRIQKEFKTHLLKVKPSLKIPF